MHFTLNEHVLISGTQRGMFDPGAVTEAGISVV